MGAGQSRNLFQAAKENELQRAIYFIEHGEDINVKDKVCCWLIFWHQPPWGISTIWVPHRLHPVLVAGWVDAPARCQLWGVPGRRQGAAQPWCRCLCKRQGRGSCCEAATMQLACSSPYRYSCSCTHLMHLRIRAHDLALAPINSCSPEDGHVHTKQSPRMHKLVQYIAGLSSSPPHCFLSSQGGHMPLHFAALQGHVEVLRALLDACPGMDVNAPDSLGMSSMHHAAVNGQEAACLELLSRGARLDPKLSVRAFPNMCTGNFLISACHACTGMYHGHQISFRSLLLMFWISFLTHLCMLRSSQNGASPLHLAAYKGRADVVKLLIGRGANYRVDLFPLAIDQTTPFLGQDPLYPAQESGILHLYVSSASCLAPPTAPASVPVVTLPVCMGVFADGAVGRAHGAARGRAGRRQGDRALPAQRGRQRAGAGRGGDCYDTGRPCQTSH